MENGRTLKVKDFCEGHPNIWSSLYLNWYTNTLTCLTCGKEVKPQVQDWKLKNNSNE